MAYQSYQAFQQAAYEQQQQPGSQGTSSSAPVDHSADHQHHHHPNGGYLLDQPPPLRTAYSEPVYASYPTYSFSPAAFDPASGAFSGDQAPTPLAYDGLAGTTPGRSTQHGAHLSEPFSRAATSLVSSFSLPAAPPTSRAFRNDHPPPQPPPPRHPGQAYSYPLPSAGPHDQSHHVHQPFTSLQDIERQLGSFNPQGPPQDAQQQRQQPPNLAYAPSTLPPQSRNQATYVDPSTALADSPSASDSIGSDVDGVGEDDDEDEDPGGPTAVEDEEEDDGDAMVVEDRRAAARSQRRAASAPNKQSSSLADETEASRTPDELAEKGCAFCDCRSVCLSLADQLFALRVTIDAVLEELRMSRATYNALSPSRKRQIRCV